MDLKPEVTATSYAVEIPVDEFLAITKRDKAEIAHGSTLFARLDKLAGVHDVEYNGHFGPCIYYTLDADHHDEHAPVLAVITKYLAEARA